MRIRGTMKPVFQTRFGKQGNCLAACVASILEVDLEVVDFSCFDHPPDKWFDLFNEKLAKIGYGLLEFHPDVLKGAAKPKHFFWIGTGMSKRGILHAVVCREEAMVHDPHPDASFVESVGAAAFLIRV